MKFTNIVIKVQNDFSSWYAEISEDGLGLDMEKAVRTKSTRQLLGIGVMVFTGECLGFRWYSDGCIAHLVS